MSRQLSTQGVAKTLGIDRKTVQRWMRAGKIKAPPLVIRDGHAVRLWSKTDVETLRKAKTTVYGRGRGRKPKRRR